MIASSVAAFTRRRICRREAGNRTFPATHCPAQGFLRLPSPLPLAPCADHAQDCGSTVCHEPPERLMGQYLALRLCAPGAKLLHPPMPSPVFAWGVRGGNGALGAVHVIRVLELHRYRPAAGHG